jgi:hypothetical protein
MVDTWDTLESWRDALPNSPLHEMPSGFGARPADSPMHEMPSGRPAPAQHSARFDAIRSPGPSATPSQIRCHRVARPQRIAQPNPLPHELPAARGGDRNTRTTSAEAGMATGVGRRTGDAGLRLLTCACRRGERASHTALPCQCSDANGRCEAGLLGVRCATAPALDPLTVRCASAAILIVASCAKRLAGRASLAARTWSPRPQFSPRRMLLRRQAQSTAHASR